MVVEQTERGGAAAAAAVVPGLAAAACRAVLPGEDDDGGPALWAESGSLLDAAAVTPAPPLCFRPTLTPPGRQLNPLKN